jgi:hypothetical protein
MLLRIVAVEVTVALLTIFPTCRLIVAVEVAVADGASLPA